MIIYKCFLCSYEGNSKKDLKSKDIGKTYICPSCKISHGCLVDTETQKEFSNDYMSSFERNKDIPIYYGIRLTEPDKFNNVKVALQVYEIIDIEDGVFVYGYMNVPGMFALIDSPKRLMNVNKCAPIKTVGKNLLISTKSKNPKNEILSYKVNSLEKVSQETPEILTIKHNEKLIDENVKLTKQLFEIDVYKILMFDINYLIESSLRFKNLYSLPNSVKIRMHKKYKVTRSITYQDFKDLNNLWHTYDIFYLNIPRLDYLEKYLKKAWESKAVCCGVVPFAPLSDWYKKYILNKADIKLLKQETKIPFPMVEFSYRYNPKRKKSISITPMLTKKDKELGQRAFNFVLPPFKKNE